MPSETLRVLLLASCLACLAGCASVPADKTLRAAIVAEAAFDCFAPGTKDEGGALAYCETSAAVAANGEILLASDKSVPGGSPAFSVRLEGNRLAAGLPRPLTAGPLPAAAKIEGFAATPDGRHNIATTAFDRYDPAASRWDAYNTLLIWPAGHPAQARIVAPRVRDGIVSSAGLRTLFLDHLKTPYFKIEGLMALPERRLVFGIRETGRRYDDFSYRILMLDIRYRIEADGSWTLEPPLRTLLDFAPDPAPGLPRGLGLSSIEYDPASGRIFLLTSHEADDRLGALLWHTDIAALDAGLPPKPVLDRHGRQLSFSGKAEGLAILDARRLFVIHDDDRVTGGKHDRQPHQAVYGIVELAPPTD